MATVFDAGTATARSARGRTATTTKRTIPVDRDEALRQVYRWHHERLIGFFVRRTGDRSLAEDLAQDVIVRFVDALDRFDPTRPVWPYLLTIANNLLTDHLRVDGRQVAVDAELEFAAEPAPGSDLDDTIILRTLLDGAVADLCDRQRIAVELRCERGWSVPDAAEFLGIDPGAFSQLLFRARKKLRAALDESGARVRGFVLPVLLDLRLRTRMTADRVREFAQPTTSLGMEAVAGVAVAATIGVTAVVGITGAEAEPYRPSPQVMDWARHDAVLPAPAVEPRDWEFAVGTRYTPASAPEAGPDAGAQDTSPPSTPDATVIEAPDAVPDSGGNVTVADDEEYFVVSSEVAARTGVEELEEVGAHGDTVGISCTGPDGQLLCGESQ